MRVLAGLLLGALALGVSGCANLDPARQQLAAGAPEGILLLKLKPTRTGYNLVGQQFDPANHLLKAGSFKGGWASFDVDPGMPYAALKVVPGTYVFSGLSQQSAWMSCFQDSSVTFDLKAGEVLYLGEFDPVPILADLQRKVVERGETVSMNNRNYFYFDNIPAPHFDFGPDRDRASAEAETYVHTHMTKVSAPVRLAEFHQTTFGIGYDAFHIQRVCGGYYKESAAK